MDYGNKIKKNCELKSYRKKMNKKVWSKEEDQ